MHDHTNTHPVIQRCQLHKLRNLYDRLPDGTIVDGAGPTWYQTSDVCVDGS
jgi:hypothetical protein